MLQHQIQIETTAHFFTLGEPSPAVRQFWLVCHGYAQTADSFLKNFDLLDRPEFFVVAPEGLNNFYRKGFDGEVVATWMTRRHRATQIEGYSNFLQKIYQKYLPLLPSDVRIVLLGFSQGAATICRWMLREEPHFHDLLLWAGLPPEDLDYQAHADYLKNKNLYLLHGTDDPFISPERLAQLEAVEQKNQIDFQEKQFSGGHEIPRSALADWLAGLSN